MKRIAPSQLENSLLLASKYTEKELEDIISKLSVDAFRELVQRSAKDTGYLRSNWDVVVDTTPPNGVLKNPNPKGSYTKATVPSIAPKADSKVILYNNTEYAIYLELGTAHMRAQPMIQPVFMYVERVANRLAKNLSQEKL